MHTGLVIRFVSMCSMLHVPKAYRIYRTPSHQRCSAPQAHCTEAPSFKNLRLPASSAPIESLRPGDCFIFSDLGLLKVLDSKMWVDGLFVRYHPHASAFTDVLVSIQKVLEEDTKLWMTNCKLQGSGIAATWWSDPHALAVEFGAKVYMQGAGLLHNVSPCENALQSSAESELKDTWTLPIVTIKTIRACRLRCE